MKLSRAYLCICGITALVAAQQQLDHRSKPLHQAGSGLPHDIVVDGNTRRTGKHGNNVLSGRSSLERRFLKSDPLDQATGSEDVDDFPQLLPRVPGAIRGQQSSDRPGITRSGSQGATSSSSSRRPSLNLPIVPTGSTLAQNPSIPHSQSTPTLGQQNTRMQVLARTQAPSRTSLNTLASIERSRPAMNRAGSGPGPPGESRSQQMSALLLPPTRSTARIRRVQSSPTIAQLQREVEAPKLSSSSSQKPKSLRSNPLSGIQSPITPSASASSLQSVSSRPNQTHTKPTFTANRPLSRDASRESFLGSDHPELDLPRSSSSAGSSTLSPQRSITSRPSRENSITSISRRPSLDSVASSGTSFTSSSQSPRTPRILPQHVSLLASQLRSQMMATNHPPILPVPSTPPSFTSSSSDDSRDSTIPPSTTGSRSSRITRMLSFGRPRHGLGPPPRPPPQPTNPIYQNVVTLSQQPGHEMPIVDLAHNGIPVRPGRHIVSTRGSILGDRPAIPIGSPVSAEERAAMYSASSGSGRGSGLSSLSPSPGQTLGSGYASSPNTQGLGPGSGPESDR